MRHSVQVKGGVRQSLLMAEFTVRLYSDGRIDWGELEDFVVPLEVDARKLIDLVSDLKRHA
jgi:hypothetical protein